MNAYLAQQKRLIFLTEEAPYPPQSGGKLRDYFILESLREHYSIEVLTFSRKPSNTEIIHVPPRVRIHWMERTRTPLWRKILGIFRSYVVNGYSQSVDLALLEMARPTAQVLWISRLAMAKYIPKARALGYTVILDEHNVESDLLLRSILRRPWNLYAFALALDCRIQEMRFCALAQWVVAVSTRDAKIIHKWVDSKKVTVIPNRINSQQYQELRSTVGQTLLFVGTLDYGPNVEGLTWFIKRVLPHLRSLGNSAIIQVAGARPSPKFRLELEAAGIEVVSNPVTLTPLLKNAALVFVPLLSGGGSRFKILEAMAAGRAVVSTTKGAEGLDFKPNQEIAIADNPLLFAETLIRVYGQNADRKALVENAIRFVEAHHNWRTSQKDVQDLLAIAGEKK